MQPLLPGIYRITQNVKNPLPDRRSKRFDKQVIWEAGTRVIVRSISVLEPPPPEGIPLSCGTIHPLNRPWQGEIHFSQLPTRSGDAKYQQGNELTEVLQREPESVGILVHGSCLRALLATLVDLGQLNLSQIREALLDLEKRNEEDYQDLLRRHGF